MHTNALWPTKVKTRYKLVWKWNVFVSNFDIIDETFDEANINAMI